MEYISSFTKTLVCVMVISFILRSLLPRSTLEKYINFVIGLIVSVTLVGAFSNAGVIEFEDIAIARSDGVISENDARGIYNRKIAESFEMELKRSVHETVREVSGLESECDVMLKLDLDGSVTEIEGIYVKVYGLYDREALCSVISERLGVDEKIIHIGGAEYE